MVEIQKNTILDRRKLQEEDILRRNLSGTRDILKKAKVCILGVGGLGSNVAVYLARSGVGQLNIIDCDVVEASNLNRQHYTIEDIGKRKVEALQECIAKINPFVKVNTKDIRVNDKNILDLIRDEMYICEAFDKADMKAMVVREILSNFPDKIVVSASGMAGMGSANSIQSVKKMKNLYVCGDFYSDEEIIQGIMSPRVSICAGHQANVILRLILGMET